MRLSTDLISVEAGATMPLSIEVVNRAEEADRFELEVEGLDPEWTAVPVPTFMVQPGDTATEKVFFRTPRTPESQSGNYPFVAKVRSLSSGEQRSVQAVLQVQPYHHITAEISPKRGVIASFKRRNHFTLTLINLGNVEHSLQLLGNDPDEALAFDFDQDQVTLGPGQQKDVGFVVQTTSKAFLASVKLHGFSITARSVDTPSVAVVAQAQLEQRPTFTPTGLVITILVLGIAWLWWYSQPRPPTFQMGLSQTTVNQGDTVSVWWQVTNADRVHIEVGEKVYDNVVMEGKGSINYLASGTKPVNVIGYAIGKDNKKTPAYTMTLNIVVPPPAPAPQILDFSANTTKVKVGDSVIFTYKFNDAVTSARLSPLDKDLNLKDSRIEIPITEQGDKIFTIYASNRDNSQTVSKSITIHGNVMSDVKVISFTATPKVISSPGQIVAIDWQLTNAIHAEISPNANVMSNEVDPNKGHFELFVDKTTTFTLTAKDKNNVAITQTVRVVVEPPPPPAPSTTGTTPGTTGTTASPPLGGA